MHLQYSVCMVALCKGHTAHFASSQACTHAHINIMLRMCSDVCTVNIYLQSTVAQHAKTGKHSTQSKGWKPLR